MTRPTEPKGFLTPDELAELRQLHANVEAAELATREAQAFLNEEVALRTAFVVRLKRRHHLEATDAIDLDTGACKATPGPAGDNANAERRRTGNGHRDAGADANAGADSNLEGSADGSGPNDLPGGG